MHCHHWAAAKSHDKNLVILGLFSGFLQSSKVSRGPIKRLTRRDKSRRGQDGGNDPSERDRAAATSSACSSPSQSDIVGRELFLRRRTLLFEDQLQWEPHHLRNAISSCPDLNTDAHVSGPRSAPLHPQPSASSQGQSLHCFLKLLATLNGPLVHCVPSFTIFCSFQVRGCQMQLWIC